ncbi:MAG: tRNA (N(6)-L-threonylcarbamoyladenosine(37)-C(2))-methylthiotransferase MtaB [Candidatus Marinimicrobia bacterium]|nr:tRNA (N(6)-L-threonylcarbamoyladenosine(37)-C(2))-methylthiotransferase MtaB [Candidatus Neomarinimicrobiota bacterium]|tara:strand:- start:735 stop:2027 length:1293 start_codon:yes stop_codon:yes gene_type:complete
MGTPTKKVAFYTLGCKLNFSETSTIARDFVKYGFEKVEFDTVADFYVINTCSVTENADKEAKKLIRKAKRNSPDSKIAVIGCFAQLQPNSIARLNGVDIVLGANDKFDLIKYLNETNVEMSTKVIRSDIDEVHSFKPSYSMDERTRSYLKVQDGCDYTCSFCTIPLARGKSRSGTISDTIKAAREIAKSGNKEIVLTGVNIGDFGKGNDESFIDLIKALESINEINRIRISSIEPNLLTDEIIEFCNFSKKFMPHFHIPLQSGSDKILKAMRRRYDKKLYQNRIKKIKDINQDTCIGVDVIVGFPGESKEDFLETYNFLIELDITYLHVFTYSERADTYAIKLDEKVSKSNKSKRSKMLHILSEKKKHSFYNNFINKKRPILFEGLKNGFLVGHTDNYIKTLVKVPVSYNNKIVDINLMQNKGNHMVGYI